jgi:hypothetical protein
MDSVGPRQYSGNYCFTAAFPEKLMKINEICKYQTPEPFY